VVDKQFAFNELATVKAGENYFASKIEMPGLKAFAPDRSSVGPSGFTSSPAARRQPTQMPA
jgi:hypothetical protein